MWAGSNHHCFSHNTNWLFKGFAQDTITPNYLSHLETVRVCSCKQEVSCSWPKEKSRENTANSTSKGRVWITNAHIFRKTSQSKMWPPVCSMCFTVCVLVINVTVTQDGCKSVKPILHNCQTNYIIFKHHSSPEVFAGNCPIVLTLALNNFVSRMTRKVGLPVGQATFGRMLCVSDWPDLLRNFQSNL